MREGFVMTATSRFSGRATLKSIADREAERVVASRHRKLASVPANSKPDPWAHWWD